VESVSPSRSADEDEDKRDQEVLSIHHLVVCAGGPALHTIAKDRWHAARLTRPMALDKDGSVMDFDERAVARWVQVALTRILDQARGAGLQQRAGLTPDGVVGPLTRQRLRTLLAAGTPSPAV
jgi:hypothetical protein